MEDNLLGEPLTPSTKQKNHTDSNTDSLNDVIVGGARCNGGARFSDYHHHNGMEDVKLTLNIPHECSADQRLSADLEPQTQLSSNDFRCLLILSLLSVVCFCPTGIFAVVTTAKLLKARKVGNETLIGPLSARIKMLVSLSMGIWIVILVFSVIVYFVNIFGIRSYFT